MMMFACPLGNCSKKTKKNKPSVSNILNNDSVDLVKVDKLLATIIKLKHDNDIIKENVYDDLEVFKGIDKSENSILNSIDRTKTISGKILFKNLLNNPTTNIEVLKKRQNIIKELTNNKLLENINKKLEELCPLEKTLIWLLKDKTSEERKLIDSVYFKQSYLKVLNNQEEFLTLYSLFKIVFSPVYGVVSPMVFLILPYLYLYFFTKLKFDFGIYLKIFKMSFFGGLNLMGGSHGGKLNMSRYFSIVISVIIYFQNLMNSFELAKNTNEIINILHYKINDVNKLINTSLDLYNDTKDILDCSELKHTLPEIKDEMFTKDPCLFSNKGKILINAIKIQDVEKIRPYLDFIGTLDCYTSLANLYNSSESKDNKICYPSYLENQRPHINVSQVWHPYLDSNAVCNDISIGNNAPQNIIITGPNAGGKSTLIKSLTLSIIFAQTFGICFGESMSFTPFSLVNTYLNIPDCKGKESLFEAEMYRARNHIMEVSKLETNQFSFIVMDEIFSSTNPEEGISGGYAIAEKLASFDNSISIITTHFTYLTNLEKDGKYKNYKIPIERDSSNNICYKYKLVPGVSNQYIALELLKNKGFDQDLVDNARNICSLIGTKSNSTYTESNSSIDKNSFDNQHIETQITHDVEPTQDFEPAQDVEATQDVEPSQDVEARQDVEPTQDVEARQDAESAQDVGPNILSKKMEEKDNL